MKKIAVESSILLVHNKTGVEHYGERLLRALFEQDQSNLYSLVYMAFITKPNPDFQLTAQNVKQRRIAWMPGKLYNLLLRSPFGLPIDVLAGIKPDIFFFPNFVRWPLLITKKSVTVVHDLGFIEVPHVLKTKHHRWYLSVAVPRSLKRSSHVVAISEATKRDVITHYGIPADHISVITPAVDHSVFYKRPAHEVNRVKQKYGVNGNYVLYLGTVEPRKNIMGIIRAYAALPAEARSTYKLVLAGGKGWSNQDVQEEVKKLPQEQVIFTGYVADEDVPALYSGASVFLYPSIFEGWGMQVVEAMACGAPVITANNSSLPEAGGKAARYVDAYNQSSINQTVLEVVQDENLRKQMSIDGIAHSKRFSWEKSGRQLKGLFDRL